MKVFKGLFKKDKYDNFDFILFATIIVLLSFGIIMVYSASFYKAIISEDNSMYFFIRQAGFGFIGFCGMVLISRIDYKKYRKFARLGLIVSFIAIGITILKIPGITHSAYGATRWL